MSFYETVFIARQDITQAQVDALTDAASAVIIEQGGEVSKKEYWGLKNLAYRIKKNRKGHFVLLNINAPPAAIIELERTMRINEDVLRYLSIRVEALEEGPSAMLQNRGERPERGRRRDGDDRFEDEGFERRPRPERGFRPDAPPDDIQESTAL